MSDRLRELLKSADCVPSAPDCRNAVMERIEAGRRGLRLAWAYALGAVLIAALALSAVLLTRPGPAAKGGGLAGKPAVVRECVAPPAPKLPVVVRNEDRKAPPIPEPRRFVLKSAPTAPRRAAGVDRLRHRPARHVPTPGRGEIEAVVKAPPARIAPDDAGAEQPLALVVVSFTPDPEKTDMSYRYTQHDEETGETTRCSASRTGNLIEIHMESTTNRPDAPVKGSVDDERANSA